MLNHFMIAVIIFLIAAVIGSATLSAIICLFIKLIKKVIGRKNTLHST